MTFFQNFGWKVLSLFVAFTLWFMVMSSNTIEISKDVALDINVPSDLVVANEIPDKITFRLSGSKFFLRTVVNSLDSIKVDLTHAQAGQAFYRIERESLHLPIGVKILSISPATINPVLEPVLRREVSVQVQTQNHVPMGFRLVKLQAMPERVKIRGPKSEVEKISIIRTAPIDLSDISSSLKWEIPLGLPSPRVHFEEDVEPKVTVEVEPTGSNFRIAGIPLQIESSKKARANVEKVALYVNCPPKLVHSLTPDMIKAYVKMRESKSGIYVKEVSVQLPQGVKLVRIIPERIQVKIE